MREDVSCTELYEPCPRCVRKYRCKPRVCTRDPCLCRTEMCETCEQLIDEAVVRVAIANRAQDTWRSIMSRWAKQLRSAPASEEIEGVQLMTMVRILEKALPDLRWLHHIPNGGQRGKAVAGKLKAQGVRQGVSDYMLPCPRRNNREGAYHGLYLELKRSGRGFRKPSKEQLDFGQYVANQGYMFAVARGHRDALIKILCYLGEREVPEPVPDEWLRRIGEVAWLCALGNAEVDKSHRSLQ